MQRTSEAYRRELEQPFAGQALIKITFGLVDADAAATSVVAADEGLPWSTPHTIVYQEGAPGQVYATLEPGRLRADGRQLIPPHSIAAVRQEGFVSRTMSGADGSFAECPAVIINFSKTHTVPALTFTFDASCEEYPSRLRLRALRGEQLLCDRELRPTAAVYTADGEIERFDRLEITFLATAKPYRRARLQQLLFGVGMLFDNSMVQSATQKLEVDPIGRRLPQSSFKFDLVNTNLLTGETANMYDPDNPKGIWRYMEQRSPIKVEYGQTVSSGIGWSDLYSQNWSDAELTTWQRLYEGGFTEWLPGGRYYLNAAPTVNGLYAKFTADDAVGFMDGKYTKGNFDGKPHSLFDLAAEVLEDAGLPQIYSDRPPWLLWEGLREIYTTAPLPLKPHRELLQLIAHAGCCLLYADRDGIVRIEPAPAVRHDLEIDFSSMLGEPKASKIAALYRVDCPAYSYRVEQETKQLHQSEYLVEGESELSVTFLPAVVEEVTVEGGRLLSCTDYANGATLRLEGGGTVTVTVSGRAITASSTVVSAISAGADENGAVETLDNPLITSTARARAVADWVRDWLEYRTTYEFESRGNPECDPLDIIRLQSSFDKGFEAVVLKNEVMFDGALKGKMICKRRVKGET